MDFPLSSGRIGYYEELLALENKFQKSKPFITVLKKLILTFLFWKT